MDIIFRSIHHLMCRFVFVPILIDGLRLSFFRYRNRLACIVHLVRFLRQKDLFSRRTYRNLYHQWTLDDLVEACSDALYKYEGIRRGISRRTVQLDIQVMHSERLVYNVPIEVYKNKYYQYAAPNYSIPRLPLSDNDIAVFSDAVDLLCQFLDFDYFSEILLLYFCW